MVDTRGNTLMFKTVLVKFNDGKKKEEGESQRMFNS